MSKKDIERYLEQTEGGEYTIELKRNILNNLQEISSFYKKELYELNYEQIDGLLYLMQAGTIQHTRNKLKLLLDYTDWAINEGLTNYNYYKSFPVERDFYKKYIQKSKSHQLYFDKEDFNELLDDILGYQDKAVIVLSYYGVSVKEIAKIKVTDISSDYTTVKVEDREVKIDEKYANILKEAIEEEYYVPKGSLLNPSIYLIKKSNRKPDDDTPVSHKTIHKRIKSQLTEMGYLKLTPMKIAMCRVADFIKENIPSEEEFEQTKIATIMELVKKEFPDYKVNTNIKMTLTEMNIYD